MVKLNKRQQLYIPLSILGGIILFFMFSSSTQDWKITTVEGDWDISELVKEQGYEIYLVEERDFDYTAPNVFNLAQTLKQKSSDPKDAVKDTIRYVAKNVRYSSAITVPFCYEETASAVLSSGQGDCVSMSRLVVSLLRAQGIPSRTKGGCLTSERCKVLFATIPFADPKVTPMSSEDFKKRGFLHEWVEVWTPDDGWFTVEATSGQIFDLTCNTYLSFGYDNDRFSRCVIKDSTFWNTCSVA